MDAPHPETLIPQMMRKARAFLRSAERDLATDEWFRAADAAYYAVFHAMTAALAAEGLTYSKHSGVVGFFRLHFIKAGVFPAEFSEIIGELQEQRELADYSYEVLPDEALLPQRVANARTMVESIAAHLRSRGYALQETPA